ncbi:MAG: agmatinase [Deltaproteobacteria bacterium RBG_16_54_18]|nr:MAG: agmatinase [Deltaproteobacteria bacterium RBG_16_54_18]
MDLQFSSRSFLAAHAPYDKSTAVVIGCPLDSTSSFRSGTRFAPQAIRDASWGLETYSLLSNKDLDDLEICDAGDILLPQVNVEGALELIQGYLETVIRAKKFPILLGGEHLISLSAVRALIKYYPNLLVIQLDAHADLRQEYLGDILSHATVMRRIADILGGENICQLGIRSGTKEEIQAARIMGSLAQVPETLQRAAGRPVYLTVDLDVLDPAVAPGVGTPEPGGLTFVECITLISQLSSLRVIGFDVVELSPPYDPTQQSVMAAAKLIRELILHFCPANTLR